MEADQQDIRWEQRFANYCKALNMLRIAVELVSRFSNEQHNTEDANSENIEQLQKEGVIQRFEYTHELAWKVMMDYEKYQGIMDIKGSRDAVREAFNMGLVQNGDVWMDMIRSRNETSHTYNSSITDKIFRKVVSEYFPEFERFKYKMDTYLSGSQTDIFNKEME